MVCGVLKSFSRLAGYKHVPKQQSPLYTTSNSVYGAKIPTEHELPSEWVSGPRQYYLFGC